MKHRFLDVLLLTVSAAVLCLVGFGSFAAADRFQINATWIIAAWVSALFYAVVGWRLRDHFRSRPFILFFAGWLLLQTTLTLILIAYVSWVLWLPAIFFAFFIGYMLMFRFLGILPPDEPR